MTLPQPTLSQATRTEWQAHLRSNESVYLANDAPPQQLSFLVTIYFGHSKYAHGESPRERLWQLLEDDRLVELVLGAFVAAQSRGDLPSVQEVLDLAADHEIPFLAWPLLAGLEQLALQANDEDAPLEGSCAAPLAGWINGERMPKSTLAVVVRGRRAPVRPFAAYENEIGLGLELAAFQSAAHIGRGL